VYKDTICPLRFGGRQLGKSSRTGLPLAVLAARKLARHADSREQSPFAIHPPFYPIRTMAVLSHRDACITSGISDKTFVSLSILPCLMDGKSTTRRKGRLVVSLLRPPGSASLRVLAFVPLLFNHRSLSRSQVWCNPFGV
jgi:hypothetical protein